MIRRIETAVLFVVGAHLVAGLVLAELSWRARERAGRTGGHR